MKLMLTLLLIGAAVTSHAQPVEIQPAQNLAAEGRQAATQGKVLLLYVSRPDCPYCAALEKEVLGPLQKDAALMSSLHLRELSWRPADIIDFNGRAKSADDVVNEMNIVGTPTLLFLDAQGNELAEPIVGYYSVDFYWAYFERAIAQAVASLADRPDP